MSEQEFVINGRTYRSIDQVPPQYRALATQMFADADGDGMPDVLESGASTTRAGSSTTFRVDGRTYRSIDDVPEPHRSGMRAAFTAPNPEPRRDQPATADGTALARPARMSSRAKLILGFVLIDAVITLGIIWWLTS